MRTHEHIPARDGRRLADADLKPGDIVQHAQHGSCRVLGWGTINDGGKMVSVLRAEPAGKPGTVVRLNVERASQARRQ